MTSWVKQSVSSRVGTVTGIPNSALGAVGEGRFFEIMTVQGEGQFVCYPPRSDIEGTDLLVKRRYREGAVAVQIKTRDYRDKYGNLTLAIEAADLPLEDPKLIVVFDYELARAQLGRFCWVIPSTVYREQSTLTGGKYEANLSRKATAAGRWVDYRYAPGDLPWVIAWYVDGRNAAPAYRWMAPPRVPKRKGARATRASRPRRAPRRAVPRRASRPRSRRRR